MSKSMYYYWDIPNQEIRTALNYYQIPEGSLLIDTVFRQNRIEVRGDSQICNDYYLGEMTKEAKKFRTHLLLMGITLKD